MAVRSHSRRTQLRLQALPSEAWKWDQPCLPVLPSWWDESLGAGGGGVVLGKFEEGDDVPQRGSDESFANLARKGFSLFLILKIKEGI